MTISVQEYGYVSYSEASIRLGGIALFESPGVPAQGGQATLDDIAASEPGSGVLTITALLLTAVVTRLVQSCAHGRQTQSVSG